MCVKHTTEIILTQPNQTQRRGPINTASRGHQMISINVKISNLKISLIKKTLTKNKTRGLISVTTKQSYVLSRELQAVLLSP